MRRLAILLALYPLVVAGLIVLIPLLRPRDGPLALAAVLLMHLALAGLVLLPFALRRDALFLRLTLIALTAIFLVRFGGEWVSLPTARAAADGDAPRLSIVSWNLEEGTRAGVAAATAIRSLDVDVVVLQELGQEHATAIEADAELVGRFPYRELIPLPGVLGMGLLSAHPIVRSEFDDDPLALHAVLDLGGRPVTVVTAHPLPGRIGMVGPAPVIGPIPVSFDPTARDAALERFRARVDAAIEGGETVVIAGDFNVAPTEPAYGRLVDGLVDAHVEVGLGPGWTWRPSRLEGLGMGFLRIDLALAGPGAVPVHIAQHCEHPGDHCQVEARFVLGDRP